MNAITYVLERNGSIIFTLESYLMITAQFEHVFSNTLLLSASKPPTKSKDSLSFSFQLPPLLDD